MPHRIAIFGVFQAAVTILGFAALGIHMKMMGYPQSYYVVWNPFAVFLRQYGPCLLAVVGLWMAYAMFASRRDTGLLSFNLASLAGLVLLLGILVSFLYAFIFPVSRFIGILG